MFDRSRLIKFNSISSFLFLSYFACWVSISTTTIDIVRLFDIYKFNSVLGDTSFQKIKPDIIEYINFLRQIIVFIIFPVLLYLNIIDCRKNISNTDLGLFALLLYFLFQIPGLIFTENSILNIGFVISALNIILIFNLSNSIFDKKTFKFFIYLSLFFLILITFLNKGTYIRFIETNRADGLYLYFDTSTSFLDKTSPRSTGSSRTLLFIYIILLFLFNKFFEKNKKIKIALYLILATLILLFQSRATIILLLVFLFTIFFIENKFSIKNFIEFSIKYFLLPVLCLYFIVYFKNFESIKKKIDEKNISKIEAINENFNRPIDPSTFSSGRINDWKKIINKTSNSLFFGYGSQADRFLINQSSSSGFVYAFSSSGLIGFIFYLFFLIKCLKKILNILIIEQKLYSKKTKLCSIIVLICILRSFLESSFAVFSVDFIILTTFYNYIKIYNLNRNNA